MRARDPGHTSFIDIAQLVPRDVRPAELRELRSLWWRQAALGHRLPAECGKHIQKSIESIQHAHDESEPARRMKSRPARWADAASHAITALEELQNIQSEYQDWIDTLPDNLRESAVAEKLESITEIDFDSAIETVSAAEDADFPLGFGRD